MTRQEFVQRWRHELGGLVADAYAADAKGSELAIRMRYAFRRIDELLGQMHHELNAPVTPANGKPPAGARPATGGQ